MYSCPDNKPSLFHVWTRNRVGILSRQEYIKLSGQDISKSYSGMADLGHRKMKITELIVINMNYQFSLVTSIVCKSMYLIIRLNIVSMVRNK